MRKTMKKFALLILVFVMFAFSVNASDCVIRNACLPGENVILKVSSSALTNLHLSISTDPAYTRVLCCDNLDLAGMGPSYPLLNLSASTNAHAKISLSTLGDYPVEIRVNKPIYYKNNWEACIGATDCVIKLSAYSNAHAAECTQGYEINVCAGAGGPSAIIDMKCGDVKIDGLGLDPSCVDPGSPSSWDCLGLSDACVYNNSASTSCTPFGESRLNQNGKLISCSNNNYWCPDGMSYDSIAGECALTLNHCDMGHTAIAPLLTCNILPDAFFSPRKDICLTDFNGVTNPPPYRESCCYNYTWTNNTVDFMFYAKDSIIII